MYLLLLITASASFADSFAEFIDRFKNFNIETLNSALVLMMFCILGVFLVLCVFFLLIRLLQKCFPPKDDQGE